MKVSKLVALIGVALVSVFSTGCLQGPVADGGRGHAGYSKNYIEVGKIVTAQATQ